MTTLEQISALLDEPIQKGLKKSRRSKIDKIEEEIVKSLTFNPSSPHVMNEESPYYNPYIMLGDGSFAPRPAEFWEEQNPSAVGTGGYDTVRQFYKVTGDAPIAEMFANPSSSVSRFANFRRSFLNDLFKGGSVPIGTTHEYGNGNSYKKVAEGKWVEVAGREKRTSHLLEHPVHGPVVNAELEKRAAKEQAIKEALKMKQREDMTVDRAKKEAMQAAVAHTHKVVGKMYDGKPPKEVQKLHDDAMKEHQVEGQEHDPKSKMEGLHGQLKPKTHHVEVSFTHQGKDYKHRFENVAAENHSEAIQKVTEGMKQKLPGHVVTRIHAETPKQAPKQAMEGPAPTSDPKKPSLKDKMAAPNEAQA